MACSLSDTIIIDLPWQTPSGTEVVTLALKPPSTVSLASALNRLLRCTHPAHRNREVFSRWLNQHWASPPPEKHFLDLLPITALSELTHQWLGKSLHQRPQDTPINQRLHQHFFDEDCQCTNLSSWAAADLAQLQLHRHPDHHPEHYRWPCLTHTDVVSNHAIQILSRVLADHGYDASTLTQTCQPNSQQLAKQYLAIRLLQKPFPWATCFNALLQQANPVQPTHWQTHYPHLRHGLQVYHQIGPATHHFPPGTSPNLTAIRPVKHWVFVEGITETTLLPAWAQYLGLNLANAQVAFIETGGKKPMLNKINELKTYFSGQVSLLLDSDASPDRPEFEAILDPSDNIHILTEGTIEDTYGDTLIVEVINTCYHPVVAIQPTDIAMLRTQLSDRTTKPVDNIYLLKTLFNEYELESNASKPTQGFDKVSFARHVLDITAQHPQWIPQSIAQWMRQRFTEATP